MARRISQSLRRQRRAERKGHQEIWCEPRGEAKLTGKNAKNQRGRTATQSQYLSQRRKGRQEEPVFNSIVDKIRQESGIATEIPADRLINRSCARRRENWERVRKADRRQ